VQKAFAGSAKALVLAALRSGISKKSAPKSKSC
jgi:hypothetical protein